MAESDNIANSKHNLHHNPGDSIYADGGIQNNDGKMNVVIFGAPGSGKGTQSEHLVNRYGLHHISTGEVLRDHIARGTQLGKVADHYISKGNLIPDDLMVEVLADVLDSDEHARNAKGVIFDGFPRTIAQARALDEMLAQRGTKVHAVVGLEVPEELLTDRILKRGAETGRADDNEETVKKRLSVYHKQTQPLKQFYKDQGTYHSIDGQGDIHRIANDIFTRLDPLSNK